MSNGTAKFAELLLPIGLATCARAVSKHRQPLDRFLDYSLGVDFPSPK
jgi:hypothetical protein